jgi:hypothetical protein
MRRASRCCLALASFGALSFAASLVACGDAATGGGGAGSDATGSASSASSMSTTGGSGTASGITTTSGTGGGGLPAGWLYTSGDQILVSDGNGGGTPWMGRGVNVDDVFFCGYNYTLWMPDPGSTLQTMMSHLVSEWHPTFVRISLSMASYMVETSWTENPEQYATPMTSVIQSLGANAGVYVLVSLRSDGSMIGQDQVDGDPEATGIPSDAKTTPDANAYPTGTDATYTALVDTFANAPYVLFGLTNEPGGNRDSNEQISAAMSHAVGVIRAEEDKLGVPHHVVSVQGQSWTSDISFYAQSPLPYDNVVYEIHGYPPPPSSYTYSNIPVIIGEYGSLDEGSAAAFYADVESKHIPNLAWDFDSFSDCAPDLLTVNQSESDLQPSQWGSIVKAYLLAH